MKLRTNLNLRALGGVSALVLALVLAAPVGAGKRPLPAGVATTEPGTYPASVVYIPGISVPGGLPECVNEIAQQIYVGEITVTKTDPGYHVEFRAANDGESKFTVLASGDFNENWGGFVLGPLGGRDDAIIGIDAANLLGGKVRGKVTGLDGDMGILHATVGAGGVFDKCVLLGPAAH